MHIAEHVVFCLDKNCVCSPDIVMYTATMVHHVLHVELNNIKKHYHLKLSLRFKLTHISLKYLRIVCVVCADIQHGYLGPVSDEVCLAGFISPSPIASDH